MRERYTKAFLAVAVSAAVVSVGVGFGLTMVSASAVPAGPAGGAAVAGPIGTLDQAGYQASGRQFRWISATITIPDLSPAPTPSPSPSPDQSSSSPGNAPIRLTSMLAGTTGTIWPSAYIQLSNGSLPNYLPSGSAGGQYARAGIEPCSRLFQVASFDGGRLDGCGSAQWVAFVEVFRNRLSSIPYFLNVEPLTGVSAGDGVGFSIYYSQGGNELFFRVTPPSTEGQPLEYQAKAHGAIFNYAAALVDFSNTSGTPVPLQQFLAPFAINEFLQGAITTIGGMRGSFAGPWTTSPVEATSNGHPYPAGTVRVSPGQLMSDGLVANGAVRPWDAFGVFARD